MFGQFGSEGKFWKELLPRLSPELRANIEYICMGRIIRLLSNRRGNGALRNGGKSSYPQGMTCMTYAICNRAIFKHEAASDTAHQIRCWRSILLSYARKFRSVVVEYFKENDTSQKKKKKKKRKRKKT